MATHHPMISTMLTRTAAHVTATGVILMSTGLSAEPASTSPVQPSWDSLKRCPIPEWIKDAKFGVYTHWGVYSVPAFATNTYGAEMYAPTKELDKRGVRAHHEKTYGPVSEFGYKDFVPMAPHRVSTSPEPMGSLDVAAGGTLLDQRLRGRVA